VVVIIFLVVFGVVFGRVVVRFAVEVGFVRFSVVVVVLDGGG